MQIEKIEVGSLNAAKYNPRKDLNPGDPEFEKLKRSIEEFGYVEPIIWNKRTGNIVGGHQRCKVLKALGHKEVDCVVLDIDEQQEKALNIALNKISGDWDMPLLGEMLKDLFAGGFDATITGFDAAEIETLFKGDAVAPDIKEDDFDIDKAAGEIKTPVSKHGDIWHIGKHRLMCGDSTKKEDVARLMDGKTARFVFTDPPWNVDYGGAAHPSWKQRTIMNDKMTTSQFADFLSQAFSNINEVLEVGGMVYVVMSGQEWGNIMNVMESCGYHWSSTIIWKKDSLVLSRKDYHTQFEPLWYGWKEGTRLCPLQDRKQSDVWDINRPKRSELHPTTKPIELVAKAILNSSKRGDLCVDLFGGSGSTLIAAEQCGRICNLMELDPKYADIICMRFAGAFSSENIFLERDGKRFSYAEIMSETV